MSEHMYDHLHPVDAVLCAWTVPGPVPAYHAAMQQQVRDAMPLLARALDRAANPVIRNQWQGRP